MGFVTTTINEPTFKTIKYGKVTIKKNECETPACFSLLSSLTQVCACLINSAIFCSTSPIAFNRHANSEPDEVLSTSLSVVLLKAAHSACVNFRSVRLISRKIPPPGKPPICPPAKRVLYHVVHHRWMRPDVVKELLWRRHVYNSAIISLRKLFKEESTGNTYEDVIAKEKREESEEFEHLLAINEERNREAAKRRNEQEKVGLKKMESEYLRSIEKELQRRDTNVKRRMEEVRQMIERSKHFVTEETLDQKLEEALDNPVVYDYAVDMQGNRYYAPVPEKYVKGIPPRQKGRMYDVTLGIEHYSKVVSICTDSNSKREMPVPPPPPPPPSLLSLSNVRSNAAALPPKTNDRSKLLSEIQAGMKLRKTVTNDRSAPAVGGKIPDLSETNNGAAVGPKIPAVGGVGGLFVNGIPKKPSDNRKNQANVFKGMISSSSVMPKSSEVHPAKPVAHTECQKQQLPVPLIECPETSNTHRQTSAGIADRLKQFNQISRPGLAPPTPPALKIKPAVKDIRSPLVKKISIPEQFKTLRPNRTANDVPSLRRSGSSDNVRNSPPSLPDNRSTPPPFAVNSSAPNRILKPACPPPPPPNQPSRIGRPLTHSFNHFSPISSPGTPPTISVDEDSPPPPPPPRIASCSDQMDRFTFIPINELPPPGIFSGIKKIYEYHPARRIQNVPSLYR
uniref:Small ribosomal subunit protein mS26 n=1 Tax=Setaria digitata TaxID=48799 RepID=A0A915PJ79_9BILA